ncbi:hypothetical protein GN244_ATG10612 [Phytophthora infestans]|uniref:Uncharacterized protein n=1 Tax=Phytophthora infestans TaxID=4787 RepID=A0A833WCL8_PHYIN|nr:hypothetical protein GN244_ATG10612 [Phytophthora infestans]KAF4142710.1 hypothetical protein GN958_ATG08102 [Phytophthora infestans]
MYDVYGSSEDRTDEDHTDEDRLARMELWLHIFAEKAGDCLEEDGGNSDDSATADDPPSSNEPSAESEPAAGFAPESELAITEPAVTESPKRKRRVTKRGAPAKKETKKPHRSTHNSAKQNQ